LVGRLEPPGARLHGELRLLTRVGLRHVEALRAATSVTSRPFGLGDRAAATVLARLVGALTAPVTQIHLLDPAQHYVA
jgi:hypothetical protein